MTPARRPLPVTGSTTIVRIPIASAAPLLERAQRLLQQLWPQSTGRGPVLRSIELRVAEFEPPRQLAFAELSRLDATGRLGGIDPMKLDALVRQEEVLAARYGDASFRHLSHIDPGSILAERRFRWGVGLPWARSRPTAKPKARRR